SHRAELGSSMLYFSLVNITTLGYGDIVPVSKLARPLAALEGVFGQLYLAVMIARLVGLHIVHSRNQDD
ncbi:MAG: two pore domain potassium channel family protein, partial [Deltaproteobacteria bacterium]|nr:two pore domain potassium channel family protein [Deltaproteobacteria bacterium]